MAALLLAGCGAYALLTAPGRIDIIDGAIRFEVSRSLVDAGVSRADPNLPAVPELRWQSIQLLTGTSVTVPLPGPGSVCERLERGASICVFADVRSFRRRCRRPPVPDLQVAGVSRQAALRWSLVVSFRDAAVAYAVRDIDATLQAFWLLSPCGRRRGARCAIAAVGNRVRHRLAMLIMFRTYVILGGAHWCAALIERCGGYARRLSMLSSQVSVGLHSAGGQCLTYGHPLETGRSLAHPFRQSRGGLRRFIRQPGEKYFLYCPAHPLALVGLRRLVKSDAGRLAPIIACLAIHVLFISSLSLGSEWAWGRGISSPRCRLSIGLPFSCEPRRVIGVVAA